MTIVRKLQNPMALAVQGFAAGAILFAALHPAMLRGDSAQADARAAAIVQSLIR
jgi:hypothetical protein